MSAVSKKRSQPIKSAASASAGGFGDRFWDTHRVGLVIGLFVVTLLAYLPVLSAGFIWDDAGHVTRSDLRTFHGLWTIWAQPGATQQYYPLLHSAFWLEYGLWGDAPWPYHLLNVLLHATSACLLARLLRRLEIPGAWIAALLFALHPVCVESVAWVTEQKNTLSGVFYLLAAGAYLNFDTKRRGGDYVAATLLFIAALLSKTVTATLPAALLVVFWWKRGRLELKRDVLPLFPWFVLAAAGGVVTSWTEHTQIGARGAEFSLSFLQRILIAGRVVWFYAGKLIWPSNLMFIYPRWNVDAGAAWQYGFPVAALAVIGVLMGRGKPRGLIAGILFFGGTLFPALGFINVFPFLFSFVADHFQYLASLGLLVPAAYGISKFAQRLPGLGGGAIVGVTALILGGLTWHQTRNYHDLETLYTKTIAQNPDCWMAHNNLAEFLAQNSRVEEALPHLEKALVLRPNFPEAENNLGDDLRQIGRAAEAVDHLRRAIALQPNFAEAHNNLGVALMMLGRTDEGAREFEHACALKPAYTQARINLGLAKTRAGHTDEGLNEFQTAVQQDPMSAQAEFQWGAALLSLSRNAEATPHLELAVTLDENNPTNQALLGQALLAANRNDEAVAHLQTAVTLAPGFAEAHRLLASALNRVGRINEASQHTAEANRLRQTMMSGSAR